MDDRVASALTSLVCCVGLSLIKFHVLLHFQQSQGAGDFDISSYSHQELDRFAVLLDVWNHHAAFLESKREVKSTADIQLSIVMIFSRIREEINWSIPV